MRLFWKTIILYLLLTIPYQSSAQSTTDSLLDAYFSIVNKDRVAAMQLAEKALESACKTRDRHNEAVALECLGVQHYYRGNYEEARKKLKAAEDLYRQENSARGLASLYNNLGLLEQDLGNYSRALAYFSFALVNDKALDETVGRALTINNMGTVYLYKGAYAEARDCFRQSLEAGKQAENHEVIGNALNNLGLVHLETSVYDSALLFFSEALNVASSHDDLYGLAIAQINRGLAFSGLHLFDSASICFGRAIAAIESLQDPDLEMEYLIHYSEYALQIKNYPGALQSLLAAQKINNRLEQKKKSAEIFRMMGTILARTQQAEPAMAYLHMARGIALSCGLLPELATTFGELSLAHGLNGNYDSARFYQDKYANLKAQFFLNEPDTTLSLPSLAGVKTSKSLIGKIFLKIILVLIVFWGLIILLLRLARKTSKSENITH
ncbi:MAG: tetratricopeptide repeat protein [Bacteroidales bacterium]